MSETNTVMTKYLPQKIKQAHLEKLDEVAGDFYVICRQNDTLPATAIARATCTQMLRNALTDDVMEPVMALQGSPLGFKTDKDFSKEKDANGQRKKGPGYPVPVVRDVFIYAVGKGARMINNEVNIIAENPYLTKNFFLRKLDEVLGAENYRIVHDIPIIIQSNGKTGAKVKSHIWWRDSKSGKEGHNQDLDWAIKGDEYASADAYMGKADRKSANWLLSNITGEKYIDGDAEDAIDVKATTVKTSLFDKTSDEPEAPVDNRTLAELIKDSPVTVEDIKAFYKAHKKNFDEQEVKVIWQTVINQVLDWKDKNNNLI